MSTVITLQPRAQDSPKNQKDATTEPLTEETTTAPLTEEDVEEEQQETRKKRNKTISEEDCCCVYLESEDMFCLCQCISWCFRSLAHCTENCCEGCAECISGCCENNGEAPDVSGDGFCCDCDCSD